MPINSLLYPANSAVAGGFDVANSCRFNSASSDYLNRTPSGAGNRRKFTISTWVKRGQVTTNSFLFGAWTANNDAGHFAFGFESAERLTIDTYSTNVLTTNRLFRDPSAFYHVVCAVDTTNGTANNRVRLYVNGVEETSFATRNNPDQNADLQVNNSVIQTVGANYYNSQANVTNDGYMSEFVLIDGQQLTPTSFGEFDEDSGIWKPIKVSGLTFGTNGFYLDFKDSGALGNDANGSNNFTVNNLTAIDQSTDTCTNNFAVGNPLLNYNPQLTEGNLVLTSSGTAWKNSMSTIGVTSGIWYHEVKITAESGVPYGLIGVTDSYHPNSWGASPPNYLGIGALQIGYYNDNGTYYQNDGQQSYSGNGFGVNDTIGVLLNLDAGTPTIKFYKNDADQGAINLPTNSNSTGLWFFMQSMYIQTCSVNYGSPAHAISSGNQDGNGYGNFEFETKGGYTLNTKNLAEYG